MFIQGSLKSQSRWKIGMVTSRFNSEITEPLETGAYERLIELGINPEQIVRVRVPGAVEIPLAARLLIDRECDAVIALEATKPTARMMIAARCRIEALRSGM